MTAVPLTSADARARPLRSVRVRRVRSLSWSIFLAVVCALLVMSAAGNLSGEDSGLAPTIGAWAMIGAFPMIGVSVLLVWRHRLPVVVAGIAMALSLVIPTSAMPALVAVAAAVAVRRGIVRWLLIGGAWAATIAAYLWDLSSRTSLLANFIGDAAVGSPERIAMQWLVPLLAAVSVCPFVVYGIVRGIRLERDEAIGDTAAASRSVAVLQQEVVREQERQELARELHDTLAASLSTLSLHAGALELTVAPDDERATAAARAVRLSAQNSLDDLRQVVHVLRSPAAASGRTSLGELGGLIDAALRDGIDVRTQVLISDAATCAPDVAHACYRLVQESLSNARKHAPGSSIQVDVRGGPQTGLTLKVSNSLHKGIAPGSVGGRQGLTGMSERVALVGGTFQAGPTENGDFGVMAWLPWQPPGAEH